MSTVFIVEDYPPTSFGLETLINNHPDFEVVGIAPSAEEALKQLSGLTVDLIILDLNLPDRPGFEIISDILAVDPGRKIIVYCGDVNLHNIRKAFEMGVHGLSSKTSFGKNILEGFKAVLNGELFLDKIAQKVLLDFALGKSKEEDPLPRVNVDLLSNREREIFQMLGTHNSLQDIADKLFISYKTALTHQTNIKQKLGIETTAILKRIARKNAGK